MTGEPNHEVERAGGPLRLGFALVPGFALMSFASATEPFRAANLLGRETLYEVRFFAERAGLVASSGGPSVTAEALPDNGEGLDAVFVCAGGGPAEWEAPLLAAWLRRLSVEGVRLGGISGGPYLLAAAGLLQGRRFTIHWEHAPALVEAFPELQPEQARFVIDGDRLTCGGGVAPLDMMHALIAEREGEAFARRVSDWFLHTAVAAPEEPQRASVAERYRVHHPALVAALEAMGAQLEGPLSRGAVAKRAGVSPRHLDRLFARQMGSTFSAEYRRLRLDHARRLIAQSALSVAEIAFASGFSSAGHLARQFKARFGVTPREARGV